jgi:hypothetical protein
VSPRTSNIAFLPVGKLDTAMTNLFPAGLANRSLTVAALIQR